MTFLKNQRVFLKQFRVLLCLFLVVTKPIKQLLKNPLKIFFLLIILLFGVWGVRFWSESQINLTGIPSIKKAIKNYSSNQIKTLPENFTANERRLIDFVEIDLKVFFNKQNTITSYLINHFDNVFASLSDTQKALFETVEQRKTMLSNFLINETDESLFTIDTQEQAILTSHEINLFNSFDWLKISEIPTTKLMSITGKTMLHKIWNKLVDRDWNDVFIWTKLATISAISGLVIGTPGLEMVWEINNKTWNKVVSAFINLIVIVFVF